MPDFMKFKLLGVCFGIAGINAYEAQNLVNSSFSTCPAPTDNRNYFSSGSPHSRNGYTAPDGGIDTTAQHELTAITGSDDINLKYYQMDHTDPGVYISGYE